MREQWTIILVESIVAFQVVGKIPVEGQRVAEDVISDIPWGQEDKQITLGDRERLGIVQRLTTIKGGVCRRNKIASGINCRRSHRGIVINDEPGRPRQSQLVSNMEPGKKLLLKLVSLPFELRVTGVFIVVQNDECPG